MQTVKVDRQDLLNKVTANREKHIAEYNEACAGYKRMATQQLEEAVVRLKRDIEELKAGQRLRLDVVRFDLRLPINRTQDYDQAIEMLLMSVEDTIELSYEDFSCLVMDKWEWKSDFEATNAVYRQR